LNNSIRQGYFRYHTSSNNDDTEDTLDGYCRAAELGTTEDYLKYKKASPDTTFATHCFVSAERMLQAKIFTSTNNCTRVGFLTVQITVDFTQVSTYCGALIGRHHASFLGKIKQMIRRLFSKSTTSLSLFEENKTLCSRWL
jgi:hypothetical protein